MVEYRAFAADYETGLGVLCVIFRLWCSIRETEENNFGFIKEVSEWVYQLKM